MSDCAALAGAARPPRPGPSPDQAPGLQPGSESLGPPVDVVVVGAGLTGLCAAFEAQRAGLHVVVLEAATRCGGVIASEHREGCLVERGPHSAFEGHPEVAELVQALGLEDQRCWALPGAARRWIVHQGRLCALPSSLPGLVGTPLFSARAKWGWLAAPFRSPAPLGQEESVAAFARRRLGAEFADRIVDPFIGGILAGDPDRVSLAALAPGLHALEQRWSGLQRLRWTGAARPAPTVAADTRASRASAHGAKPRRQSFSFKGGLQQLTDVLAQAVNQGGGSVLTHTPAQRFEPHPDGGFAVWAEGLPGPLHTRQLVLALPSAAAARLLQPLDPAAAQALAGIGYGPVTCVASAYQRRDITHPLDGFGCLVPAAERRCVLGVLFCSSIFAGRAPAGQVLLNTFVGGRRSPGMAALDDDALLSRVQAEHRALLGAQGAPIWQTVSRWPQAVAQADIGHLERVAQAQAAADARPGLHLCGSWRGGASLGDCIRSGVGVGRAVASNATRRALRPGPPAP